LIIRPSGWKPSPLQKCLRRHAQKLKLSPGFLTLECSKRSLLIVGHNLLPIFFSFAKHLAFPINKQQLITLSRTVQSKDCTATSRTHFALELRHGNMI
jgi:hypothetical protein